MKRLLLVLCLIVSMMCFSACSGSESGTPVADADTSDYLISAAQNVLNNGLLPLTTKAEIEDSYNYYIENDEEILANAMLAWENSIDDLGDYIGELSATAVQNDDKTYTVTLVEAFTKRNCELVMTVDKDITQFEGLSLNPEYTFGEKMVKAALNTVIGMAVVFVVLILIALIISLFQYIPKIQAMFSKKKEAPASAAPKAAPAPAVEPEEEEIDDLELVAVITAAIAASENTSADGLVVRSIKRARTSGWKRA